MHEHKPRFARNAAILQREVDDNLFLIDDANGNIHALDAGAGGIWRLLEQPSTEQEILDVFVAAFPGQKVKELRRHVHRFIVDLEQKRLAVRVS